MPEVEQVDNKINYNQIRALADSKSLRLRFSDNKTFKLFVVIAPPSADVIIFAGAPLF